MAAVLALSSIKYFDNGKEYLKDKVSTYQHVSWTFLKYRVVYNNGLHSLLAIKQTLEKAIEVDDEEIETELFRRLCNPYIVEWTLINCLGFKQKKGNEVDIINFNPWEGFLNNVSFACFIDFSNTQILRWYEDLALQCLPIHTCDKLVKNVSKSAIRKAARVGRFSAATYIFKTTVEAQLLACTAQFTVGQLVYFYYGNPEEKFSITCYLGRDLPKEIIKRIGARLVIMGIGAAIGTAIKPGTGTAVALMVTDFAVTPVVSNAIDKIISNK